MTRVLLVEPDKLLARTYLQALKNAKISADWEPTAQGAVTFIDKKHPDIIVLELQLASHNGVELLYELRSHSDWQAIPVLLHTIIPESELGLTSEVKERLNIVKYCYKPQTTLENLVAKVREIQAKEDEK